MRRTIVAIAAAVAVLTTGMLPHASAAGVKKPSKIDCSKDILAPGVAPAGCDIRGSIFPLGSQAGYGSVAVTFTQPAESEAITQFILTCAPVAGSHATSGYPVDPVIDTFDVSWSGGRYISLNTRFRPSGNGPNESKGGLDTSGNPRNPAGGVGRITLFSTAFAGSKAPSVKCKVDAKNAGGTTAGKAPKLTTGTGADCGVLTQEDAPVNPDPTVTPIYSADDSTVEANSLFLRVRIVATTDSGVLDIGTFCTTDRNAYPKWLTDQLVSFTAKTKVKAKTKTATMKSFKLTAPLSSSIPLTTVGSHVVYHFDPSKLQAQGLGTGAAANKCDIAAAKTSGKLNTCTFDNTTGTITIDSTDVGLVKPGKPIISPAITVNFTYIGAPGTAAITLVSSATAIVIGKNQVDVNVDDTADCIVDPTALSNADVFAEVSAGNPQNICYAGQGVTDPNHDRPILTFTDLI